MLISDAKRKEIESLIYKVYDTADPSKINSIFNMMQSVNNPSNHSEDNFSSYSQDASNNNYSDIPDIETIMRIKKVVDSMKTSSNDPNVNLLSSLKPYMRDEKKSQIDQYIKILNMTKALSILNDMGSDIK